MAPNARANKAAEKAKLANKQKVASPSLTVIMTGTSGHRGSSRARATVLAIAQSPV